MKCPACENEMVEKTQDETLSYGSSSLTLHGMRGYFCPKCREGVWDEESYRRYTTTQEALISAARGYRNDDIRRIRKSLNLSQAKLAEIFGVGKVAFSRYERGETNPPAPVIKLLKLMERHPNLLPEIENIKTERAAIKTPTTRTKRSESAKNNF